MPPASRKGSKQARKAPRKAKAARPTKRKGKAKPARRASPAPPRVKVRRPVVHKPAPLKADLPGFVVQMDKGAGTVPLDAATGRPSPAATGMTYAASGVDIHREDRPSRPSPAW